MTESTDDPRRAVITSDPALDLPVDATIYFKPSTVTQEGDAKAAWLRNWESFDGLLLSLHFATTSAFSVEGSAIIVAPGIALCAAHVIEPHIEAMVTDKIGAVCVDFHPEVIH